MLRLLVAAALLGAGQPRLVYEPQADFYGADEITVEVTTDVDENASTVIPIVVAPSDDAATLLVAGVVVCRRRRLRRSDQAATYGAAGQLPAGTKNGQPLRRPPRPDELRRGGAEAGDGRARLHVRARGRTCRISRLLCRETACEKEFVRVTWPRNSFDDDASCQLFKRDVHTQF